jgi:hypothetical protein
MPSTFSAQHLLTAFPEAYGCLDMRLAVVRENGPWLVAAVSVHLRIGASADAEVEFKKRESELGPINIDEFRIVQRCFPIAELDAVTTMFHQRRLTVADVDVAFETSPDLLGRSGNIRAAGDDTKENGAWPRTEGWQSLTNDARIGNILWNNRNIQRTAELAGYGNPHVAIRSLLNIDFSNGNTPGAVWVSADIPIGPHSTSARQTKTGTTLTFSVRAHPSVKDIACVVRRSSFDERHLVQSARVDLTPDSKSGSVALWTGHTKMLLSRDDDIRIDVTTSSLGTVISRREYLYNLLPPAHANPLYAALTYFVPDEELATLLGRPTDVALPGRSNLKNKETAFEVSVQWLLSLLGFRAVWLHGYETLRRDKIEIGSIDCLAYSETGRLLLLVNCSLGPPTSKELGRYSEVRARLSRELFADGATNTHAVVFADCEASNSSENPAGPDVKIVRREEIKHLLAHARSGRTFSYAEFVNPVFGRRFRD